LGEDACEFSLPAGFFFAGQFGEVGESLVDGGVEGSELRKQLVADTIASVDGIGVGGVGSPGLIAGSEERFDLAAAGREQGAKDSTGARGVDGDDGMDCGDAFCPGSTEELHEDGFGLVVEGVGREDRVGVAGGDEGAEKGVANLASGFFEGFAIFSGSGGDVGSVDVERDVELDAEILNEGEVGVGFGCLADAVVDVDG
jgi:hypothetical protein